MNTKSFKILVSFIAVYLIWGSTYLAIRVIVDSAPPFISMGIRFCAAALLIFIFLLFKGEMKIKKRELLNSSIIGVLLFSGGVGMVAWAEKYVPSGIASVMVALLPLWFLVFDMLLNKGRKPRIIVWLGIFIGFAGILLLVGFKDLTSLRNVPYLPFIMILISSVLWSFAAVLSPRLEKPKNSLLNLSVQMFAGGIANTIIGSFTGEFHNFEFNVFNYQSTLALAYLVIFGSILVLSAFNYLIENVSPGLVATYSYVNPIIALVLGWLVLNEEINSQIIMASGLVLLGVAFIKLGDKPKKVPVVNNE